MEYRARKRQFCSELNEVKSEVNPKHSSAFKPSNPHTSILVFTYEHNQISVYSTVTHIVLWQIQIQIWSHSSQPWSADGQSVRKWRIYERVLNARTNGTVVLNIKSCIGKYTSRSASLQKTPPQKQLRKKEI